MSDGPFSKLKIAVLDYEAGNLRSVHKALLKCGASAVITSNPKVISDSDGLVFPGQGACDTSMRKLREKGLDESVRKYIESGKPFLGICLGLQLLLEASDEGNEKGLGVIEGRVRRLPRGVKIPHMGWNRVAFTNLHPVFRGIPDESYFYFVHSYYADPKENSVIIGKTNYGLEFCSALALKNVISVQFHPEKSGYMGLKLYSNFLGLIVSGEQVGENWI